MSTIIHYDDAMEFILSDDHDHGSSSYERLLYPLLQYNESYYDPPNYVPPPIVTDTHDQPRFGLPNNLDGVISGDEKQTRDYVTGAIIGSLIIAIVAIVWFIVIICLKIAGTKRVGFLAGRFVRPFDAAAEVTEEKGVEVVLDRDDEDGEGDAPQDRNEPPTPTNNNNSADQSRVRENFGIRVGIVRALFLLCGIVVIVSGGLFYGKGAIAFRNAINEVQYGIDMVQDIGMKAMNLADNVTAAAKDVEDQVQPDNTEEPICGLDSELSTTIRSLYNQLTANVDQLKATLDENVGSISEDVQNVMNALEEVEGYLVWSDVFFNVLIAITVVIITLIVLMMIGVLFAWKGISNAFTKCTQYALIWPLFIFSLILSWIFATLFLAAGLAGSDFCVDPDQYVEKFLYKHEGKFDGMLFGFLVYYITGCQVAPPGMKYIVEAAAKLKSVMTVTHELTALLADLPVESILLLCDLTREQAEVLKGITTLGHSIIHLLDRTMVGLREVISCGSIVPIYDTFVHQAFCNQAVTGMSWIFDTTLFIGIFSMLLLMFRAALYPIQDRKGMRKFISVEDEMEVVKYTEHEPEEKPMGGNDAEDNAPPFESVPASVYDRVTNADAQPVSSEGAGEERAEKKMNDLD